MEIEKQKKDYQMLLSLQQELVEFYFASILSIDFARVIVFFFLIVRMGIKNNVDFRTNEYGFLLMEWHQNEANESEPILKLQPNESKSSISEQRDDITVKHAT